MTIKQEQEANEFAMCLLMPEILVSQELEKVERIDNDSIKRLALKFQVSEKAFIFRLYQLGYIMQL